MNNSGLKRGFSMTELLVVVAVILILMALIIVGVDSAYSYSNRLKCQHRLEQIGYAVQMYRAGSHDTAPVSWDPYTGRLWYQTLAQEYLTNPNVLACPSVGEVPPLEGGGEGAAPDTTRENVPELLTALRWLDQQQVKEGTYKGRWTSDNTYKGGYCCGVTGLCLMAFFTFGCNEKHPPEFAETVRSAVEFLCSDTAQYKTGSSAGLYKDSHATCYGTAISVMALSAAVRICDDPELRDKARSAAQLGLNYLADIQADHGAYSYSTPATDKGDTNATSWVYQAFGAARLAGLHVPQSALDKAEVALEHIMRPTDGLSSYTFPPDGHPGWWLQDRNTQVGLNARVTFGHSGGAWDVQKQLGFLTRKRSDGTPEHIYLLIHGGYYYKGDGYDFYRHYHTTRALRQLGGPEWAEWYAVYPPYFLKHLVPEGEGTAYFPKELAGSSTQVGGGTTVGDRYSTALGITMLADAFEDHWIDPSWRPTVGRCSYGYNNRLGKSRRTIARDTILVMDYEHWEIDRDDIDVEKNDGPEMIAPRHGGMANALLGDGSVRALDPDDITDGMFTPEPGD
jgi:prepilin-type N-terminal cleavage/methylation domain-containing protein/prepilin-type processing-associated H-X9-DG protein